MIAFCDLRSNSAAVHSFLEPRPPLASVWGPMTSAPISQISRISPWMPGIGIGLIDTFIRANQVGPVPFSIHLNTDLHQANGLAGKHTRPKGGRNSGGRFADSIRPTQACSPALKCRPTTLHSHMEITCYPIPEAMRLFTLFGYS
jgi:hypothetical protein